MGHTRLNTVVQQNWAKEYLSKNKLNFHLKLWISPLNTFCVSKKDEEKLRDNLDPNFIPYKSVDDAYSKIINHLNYPNIISNGFIYKAVSNFKIVSRNMYNIYNGIKGYFNSISVENPEYMKSKLIFLARGGVIASADSADIFITDDCVDMQIPGSYKYNLHYSWIIKSNIYLSKKI